MLNLVETLRRWQRRQTTIGELSRLDDRMLADIGLRRSDIERTARKLG